MARGHRNVGRLADAWGGNLGAGFNYFVSDWLNDMNFLASTLLAFPLANTGFIIATLPQTLRNSSWFSWSCFYFYFSKNELKLNCFISVWIHHKEMWSVAEHHRNTSARALTQMSDTTWFYCFSAGLKNMETMQRSFFLPPGFSAFCSSRVTVLSFPVKRRGR